MRMQTGKRKVHSNGMCSLLCITVGDPCLPRWKLQVEELAIIDKRLITEESKRESNSVAIKIANWI